MAQAPGPAGRVPAVADRAPSDEALPAPAVSPDVYDEDYYRHKCAGYAEWEASGGRVVASIYPGALHMAKMQPGAVVVDIGTGRGELLAVALQKGASRAIGIEYSAAAADLARTTLEAQGVTEGAEVLLVDARSIPLPDGTADLVTMLDVVEHLTPEELDASLQEALRLLKPGGTFFAHTAPNRLLYDVA